jgi:hypothetical protein
VYRSTAAFRYRWIPQWERVGGPPGPDAPHDSGPVWATGPHASMVAPAMGSLIKKRRKRMRKKKHKKLLRRTRHQRRARGK